MERIPKEVLVRHSIREIANFFGELLGKRRASGMIPVCVDDNNLMKFYFVPCNENGYPKRQYIDFIEMDTPKLSVVHEGSIDFSTATFNKMSVYLEKPLIAQQYYMTYDPYPTVFMWSGRVMNKETIPIEHLNVSELMKIAQETIKLREGLIIDEAIKNKLFI